MRIGFTGTQQGMTSQQQDAVKQLLSRYNGHFGEFHHGDCIGSDREALEIATELKYRTVCHPPERADKRAFTDNHETWVPKPYLMRNHDIVLATELLIATPRKDVEELRSGTWATVRYARKLDRAVAVVFPDGRVQCAE